MCDKEDSMVFLIILKPHLPKANANVYASGQISKKNLLFEILNLL
jgi:hypothetical protein